MTESDGADRALDKMRRMKAHIAKNEAVSDLPGSSASTHFSEDGIDAAIAAIEAFQQKGK